jgi:hypothetical protein
MLIVGAGAALTATAAFFAWLFVRKCRALWREGKAKDRLVRSGGFDRKEHEHEHAH